MTLSAQAWLDVDCRAATSFQVTLRSRQHSAATGGWKVETRPENLDPTKTALVVIDMWNFHWCKTSTERVGALVPRMKHVIDESRAMGMTVFWCPTDVADNYVGTPQREAVFALDRLPLPSLKEIQCPAAPDGGGCTCGRERCAVNYGWDGMHPDLSMAPGDFMPNDLESLYTLCIQKGMTHLIFMGVHTQVCLLGKSVGLLNMLRAGFQCVLARDLTDAHGKYDPATGLTPDRFTSDVVEHFEKHLCATINFAEELGKAGVWKKEWKVDPVRFAPWGTRMRPHLFEEDLTVTLSLPWQPEAEIRYTLDGTPPTRASALYQKPLNIGSNSRVCAVGFVGDRPVGEISEAVFAKLGGVPSVPDIFLGDIKPLRTVGPGHSPSDNDHRLSPISAPPQKDRSNRGAPLRLRGKDYAHGLGVHAPNQMILELKPEYSRFVSLAGVDENILKVNSGSNLGMHPSVVFHVFIDGNEVSQSPVMRIAERPWRFDVAIPRGSKRMSLVVTDAGNGNKEDLANWVEAGFVRQ